VSAVAEVQGNVRRPASFSRGLLRIGLLFLAAGIAVGIAWALGEPLARSVTDRSESVVSGDAAFASCALVAALVTALVLAVREGDRPAARVAVVLSASLVASTLAWGVGLLVGAPQLHAKGVVLLWPFVTAVLTLLRTVVTLVIRGE
jgi:hypothetical protein